MKKGLIAIIAFGLLLSLVMDIPAWDIPFIIRGILFLLLIPLSFGYLTETIDAGLNHLESEADTSPPLKPEDEEEGADLSAYDELHGYTRRY